MRLLIVYGTGYGQTTRIANHIARCLRDRGNAVDIVDGRAVPADLSLAHYDAIVVGASVNAGRFQRYVLDFIKTHRDELQRMPSAFFSVSMTEADPDPVARARAMHPITRMVHDTGWQPGRIASFAGSMAYLRYRPLMRLIWRRVSLSSAHEATQPVGSTHHAAYEYTDWDAVTRFANDVADAAGFAKDQASVA